jgi:putative hydroxymethylpyrimidine transport system substrate-binding protein
MSWSLSRGAGREQGTADDTPHVGVPLECAAVRIALLAAVAAILLAGCGSNSGPGQQDASLVLDFTPNAVHAGIYTARAREFDTGEGVRLHIREPSASTDSVKLLLTGRADFAILDIHDLALARERGRDIVGVMALVEQPLAAVIARPGVASPRALEGRRVGVTGLPSDVAVLDSEVRGAGGDARRVKTTTIGFNAVPALLSRRVAAATAFWDVEGVTLQRRRPGFRIFKVDSYGAPSYPELVLCTTRETIDQQPDMVRGVVRALVRGYQQALADPEGSVADELSLTHGLDRGLLNAEMDAVNDAFQAPDGRVGELDPGRLRAWAAWERKFGIVKRAPDVAKTFDSAFLSR